MADLRQFLGANGARGRSRTADTVIFSHVLYQLSYPGIASAAAPTRPASDWKRAYGEARLACPAPLLQNLCRAVALRDQASLSGSSVARSTGGPGMA